MNVNPFSYLIEKLKSKADKADIEYKSGDTITFNSKKDAMYGYVVNSSTLRVFLPLSKRINASDSNVSVNIQNTFDIVTVNGLVTLTGCTVSEKNVNNYGIYFQISCTSNSSLSASTPIIAGLNMTISIS